MTGEHFDAILKQAQAKADKDGWQVLAEGAYLTLYLAHDGVPLTLQRIEAVRKEGSLLYARGGKRELFVCDQSDLFAVALEGTPGQGPRRAGF
jgi:hypothetical protein